MTCLNNNPLTDNKLKSKTEKRPKISTIPASKSDLENIASGNKPVQQTFNERKKEREENMEQKLLLEREENDAHKRLISHFSKAVIIVAGCFASYELYKNIFS